jgi:hypothetical protein
MLSPETESALGMGKVLADLRRECADLQRQCFAATPATDNGFDQAGRKWGSLLEGKVLARRNKPPYPRKFAGLDIIVENPAGSTRSGTNKSGKKWSVTMACDYGYLKKANGEDGEELDVFLGTDPKAENVYVVHQNEPSTGKYDESKVMLGCGSSAEAKALYLSNYNTPKFFRSITEMPMVTFKKMLTKAEPGSAHWRKKHNRSHETEAMFSDDSTDMFIESAAAIRDLQRMSFDESQWVTMGAQRGSDGKKHGGSPVKLDKGGDIEAGPAKLKGRKIGDLKKNLRPQKPYENIGTQRSEDKAVEVDKDLATAAKLGRLTLPTHGYALDPHLEDAYRRAAEKQGVKLGKFEINPMSGHATATIDDDGGPTPEPAHNPELDADVMRRHPLHDAATDTVLGEDKKPHAPPTNEKELSQAVARGDVPVEDILQTHPHLAGPALVEQHRQKAKADLEGKQLLGSLTRKAPESMGGENYPDPIAQEILKSPDKDAVTSAIPKGSKSLSAGAASVVLETPEGDVLRIGPKGGRPNIPEVLQPTHSQEFQNYQVERLPKVETKGITDADVASMEKQLNARGYTMSDPGTDNLGKLPDGRLVVIDAGAVSPMQSGGKPTGEAAQGSQPPEQPATEAQPGVEQPAQPKQTPEDIKAQLHARVKELKASGLPTDRAVARARIEMEQKGLMPRATPAQKPARGKPQPQEQANAGQGNEAQPAESVTGGTEPRNPEVAGGQNPNLQPDRPTGRSVPASPEGTEPGQPVEEDNEPSQQPSEPIGERVPNQAAPAEQQVEQPAAASQNPAKAKAEEIPSQPLSKSAIDPFGDVMDEPTAEELQPTPKPDTATPATEPIQQKQPTPPAISEGATSSEAVAAPAVARNQQPQSADLLAQAEEAEKAGSVQLGAQLRERARIAAAQENPKTVEPNLPEINKAIAATTPWAAEKYLTDHGIQVTDADRAYIKTRQEASQKASAKPIQLTPAANEHLRNKFKKPTLADAERIVRPNKGNTPDIRTPQQVNLVHRKPFNPVAAEAKLDLSRKPVKPQFGTHAERTAALTRRPKPAPQYAPDVGRQLKEQVSRIQAEAAQKNQHLSFNEAMKLAKQKMGMSFSVDFAAMDAAMDANLKLVDRMLALSALVA